MKTIKYIFNEFRTKITLVLIFSMLLSGLISNLIISKHALDAQFNQLRDKLMIIAQTSVLLVDTDMLARVPLTHSGVDSPAYKSIAGKLIKVKELNRPIKYIYLLAKTDRPGTLQFVVDPTMDKEDIKKGFSSYPGDRYDASRFSEMLKGFDGPAADKSICKDEWGLTLSGYAPVKDRTGKTVAILGVDIAANDVYLLRKELERRAWFVLFVGILISVVLGIIISQWITSPVRKLLEGTRTIAKSNLGYQVPAGGPNEIRELAASLNSMSKSLKESRDKLRDYFYKVVQTLVRVLEAKDKYTRGHSERVANYTEMIARKLDFSGERLENLKEAALLHDIGKLGIDEEILNKESFLTDKEWNEIKQHPSEGANILKPILLDEEMLEVAKGHHERFDGTGYPDKLAGDGINVLAQIVSIADAYDAMTSTRAYRPALGRKKAIDELRRNKNTQFNPWLVEIFIEILESER